MYRSTLLLAVLILAVGCKKGDDKGDGSRPSGDTGAVFAADAPKIQPKAKFKLPAERGYDPALRVSADGKTLAVIHRAPKYKTITQVWDISAEPKAIAEYDSGQFALSPSGKYLLIDGGVPMVQEAATKKPVVSLKNYFSYAFFRDDNTLVTTHRSHDFPKATKGRIIVWDVAKKADTGSFDIPDNRFSDAFLANNGKELWLFMSHEKFEIECYDLAGKKLARTIKPENDNPSRPVTGAGIYNAVAADGSVFTSHTNKQKFYDGATGKILATLPDDIWGMPGGLLPGGNRFLARVSKKTAESLKVGEADLVVYDWKAGKALAVLTGHSTGKQEEVLASASADGKTLVSVTKAGKGYVFDLSPVK